MERSCIEVYIFTKFESSLFLTVYRRFPPHIVVKVPLARACRRTPFAVFPVTTTTCTVGSAVCLPVRVEIALHDISLRCTRGGILIISLPVVFAVVQRHRGLKTAFFCLPQATFGLEELSSSRRPALPKA